MKATSFGGYAASLDDDEKDYVTYVITPNATLTPDAARGSGVATFTRTTGRTYVNPTTGLLVRGISGEVGIEANGIIMEPAATNDLQNNDKLSGTPWIATNMTAAFTSTGPDGVANNATRLTATSANATIYADITSSNAARSQSLWIRRITGTGNIDMTITRDGSMWLTLTVTGSWMQVLGLQNITAKDPRFAIRIVTSGDAVDVCLCQDEAGVTSTSAIITGGGVVTRNRDALTLVSAGNVMYPGSLFTISDVNFVSGGAQYTITTGSGGGITQGVHNSMTATTGVSGMAGTTASAQWNIAGATFVVGTRLALGQSYTTNLTKAFSSGKQVGATDTVCAMPDGSTANTTFGAVGSGGSPLRGHVYRVIFYAAPLSVVDGSVRTASTL